VRGQRDSPCIDAGTGWLFGAISGPPRWAVEISAVTDI
jgi:hypothetical protein